MLTSFVRVLALGVGLASVTTIVACGGAETPASPPAPAATVAAAATPAPTSAATPAANPTPTPSTYHLDAALRKVKEADAKAAELVAEFEKLKAAGTLLQKGESGLNWVEALQDQRRLVRLIVHGWQGTVADGWPATAPELKPVQACFEGLVTRFAPFGFWTSLNLAEQPFLVEWESLDRIRDKAMVAAALATAKGDAESMQELLDQADKELARALKYSADKVTNDTGRGSMYENYSLNVDKHPGFLRMKAELERYKAACAAGR